jgi:3'(2'), 5'-bisphosphate nucleotidase
MSPYAAELTVALMAAKLASDYLAKAYLDFQQLDDAPVNISTEADRESQEIILKHLSGCFPSDRLCAEENTETLKQTPTQGTRQWVVDPIDGTRGFVTKNGEFSVMIALIDRGEIVVGVVAEPALNRYTYATIHGGCWVKTGDSQPAPCQVSTISHLTDATLIQSHIKPGKPNPPFDAIKPKRLRETYSAGVKLALVARGEGELYVNTYANFADWDICAGHLLVTEAGGIVTELHGQPIQYGREKFSQTGGLLATNRSIYNAALTALQGVKLGA